MDQRAEVRDAGAESAGPGAVLLEAAASRGVTSRLQVQGISMLPLVRSGDLVEVDPTARASVRLGDVVALRASPGGALLLHRVVERSAAEVTVQGDNSAHTDGRYAIETLIGVVTHVERGGASVWFGAGRAGPLVAFAVRHGVIRRADRLYYGARSRVGRRLKFLGADSRLPRQKGDDGNE